MMQMLSGFPRDVVAFVWHDDMSASEVESALTSAAHSGTPGKRDIKLFAKLAEDHSHEEHVFSLDDATIGAGNWSDFGRIAIVTDETWVRHMVQFFAPFVHGPVRVFSNAQAEDARRWLIRRDLD
jgi:hypothetical protein